MKPRIPSGRGALPAHPLVRPQASVLPTGLPQLMAGLASIALAFTLSTAAHAELQGWFLPSTVKVLRDAQPPGPADAGKSQAFPAKTLRSIAGVFSTEDTHFARLAAARNEVEACQLVLLSDQPIDGVKVTISELRRDPNVRGLTANLFRVSYIPNVADNIPYPDPLPPLLNSPIDLEANQAKPVWISVRVPKDAPSGTYHGTVHVRAPKKTLTFRLELDVWKFTLPETPSCVTAFGLDAESIARQHGVPPGSSAAKGLYALYYATLLDHRISPYILPVDLLAPEAARYLNDPRLTSFVIPYPQDDAQLQKIVERLVQGGWFDKGFFYPVDEPVKKDAYDQLGRVAERLRRIAPGAHLIAPFFRGPDWETSRGVFDLLAGKVNIWCPNSQYFDLDSKTRTALVERRRLGERAWWYVCCGPGEPYNNFFIEMPPLSHRLLFWQQKREGIEGLLYWNTTYWNPSSTPDPWLDMATVKDINPTIHGDGALLYPGKKIGLDGPVSSIRLENIRDGLEDFEYLTLAERALGPEATETYVRRIAHTLTEFESDPIEFEVVRRMLGEEIEKNRKRLE